MAAGAARLIEDDRRLERLAREDHEIDLCFDDLGDDRGIILGAGDIVGDQQRRGVGGNRTASNLVGHAATLEALVVDDRHARGGIGRGDQRRNALSLAIVATGEAKDAAPPGGTGEAGMARPRRDHDDAAFRIDRRGADRSAGTRVADNDMRFVLDRPGRDRGGLVPLATIVLVRDRKTPAEQAAALIDITGDIVDGVANRAQNARPSVTRRIGHCGSNRRRRRV